MYEPIDFSRLKNREAEVLQLMLDPNINSKEIGHRLGIANVSQTLNRVYMICGIKSRKRRELIERFNADNTLSTR